MMAATERHRSTPGSFDDCGSSLRTPSTSVRPDMRPPALALSAAAVLGSVFAAPAQGVANPAATFCVESGGTYRTISEDAGERGICVLPDGREVDAWEHFRRQLQTAPGAVQLPNPAAAFCVDEGGQYRLVQGDGGSRGICVLPGGREVDAWDYFRERHSSLSQTPAKSVQARLRAVPGADRTVAEPAPETGRQRSG